jgi:hypothetical protein
LPECLMISSQVHVNLPASEPTKGRAFDRPVALRNGSRLALGRVKVITRSW